MKTYLLVFILFITFTCTSKEKLSIVHGPFLQHAGETGVTIVWTTNKNAVSWVEVTPTDIHESMKYYSSANEPKEPTKVHNVRISNLNPGKMYSYIVYSQTGESNSDQQDKAETVAISSIGKNKPLTFTTNPLSEKAVSFLAVNDIHGRHGRLKKLLKKADYPSADVIIFNGDMVHEMKNENHYFNGFMNTAIRMFAHEKPVEYARGNHETLGDHADAFPEYFNTPDGKLYYLIRRGPICFVVLDSGEYLDDNVINDDAEKAFDQYRDRECEWLAEALKSKTFTEASFKVVIIHIPPIGTWHGAVEVASKFVPLLNEANPDVMICGHLHRYYHRKPGDGINFPVVVNSNNTVVRAKADTGTLSLKILNRKGQQVDLIEMKK